MSKIRLSDRVVIMTGGSQGLGRAMALALADAGARLVLASPDADRLGKVANEIGQLAGQGRALTVVADITKRDDCKRVLEQSLATFGTIQVLVNNARHIIRGYPKVRFWEADPEFWQKSIHVNVNATAPSSCPIPLPLIWWPWAGDGSSIFPPALGLSSGLRTRTMGYPRLLSRRRQ